MKWAEKDSNLRRRCQQIYSLPPLATRESALCAKVSLHATDSFALRIEANISEAQSRTVYEKLVYDYSIALFKHQGQINLYSSGDSEHNIYSKEVPLRASMLSESTNNYTNTN